MKQFVLSGIIGSAIVFAPAFGAELIRTASYTSTVATDSGKCTVEVVVPGTAQVRVKGDSATLIKMSGRDPEWKRFECSSPLPKKPVDFRMETTGGRGHQDLRHGPRYNRGTAVVDIDDPGHGEDTYSFDLIWDTVR
jgi:hypothetical protein